ncbi:MAG: hypothetical protein AB4352_09055 [Hormoscilla sp.]
MISTGVGQHPRSQLTKPFLYKLPVGFNPLKLLAVGLNPRRARRLWATPHDQE